MESRPLTGKPLQKSGSMASLGGTIRFQGHLRNLLQNSALTY